MSDEKKKPVMKKVYKAEGGKVVELDVREGGNYDAWMADPRGFATAEECQKCVDKQKALAAKEEQKALAAKEEKKASPTEAVVLPRDEPAVSHFEDPEEDE